MFVCAARRFCALRAPDPIEKPAAGGLEWAPAAGNFLWIAP